MLRLGLILASASLLVACNGGGDTSESKTDTGSATDPGTETGATDTGTDPGTSTVAPTDPTSEGSGTTDTPTTAATDATTGSADEFCGGWQGADGELALSLFDRFNMPLTDGSTLPLECGGQGLFMFGLYPTFGGFTPTGPNIEFAVTADVDGYNTNPDGHFYSADPIGYYVGCEPLDGGVSGVVPVFPLDNLDDLTVLDGKYAALHVVLHTDGGDITRDLQVKLSVVEDKTWAFCQGGG